MPANTYEKLEHIKLEPPDKVLLGPCNYKLNCIGKFKATLQANDVSVENDVYVVKGLDKPLLSRIESQKLNLIHKIDAVKTNEYKTQIIEQYSKLFKGLGQIKGEYSITLKEIFQYPLLPQSVGH